MSLEPLLSRLPKDLTPPPGLQARIAHHVQQRIAAPRAIAAAQAALTPDATLRRRLWSRIQPSLTVSAPVLALDRLRALLVPPAALRAELQRRIAPQLVPMVTTPLWQRSTKWMAAFVIVALLVKGSPQMFLAPHTVALSAVTLLPTRGQVSISVDGLWQPVTEEITLTPGTILRTHGGEASILFHDDGVIRLDAGTTVELHDTSHRLEPAPDLMPTLSLREGRVWVQGLVPAHVRGLTVATRYGQVTVHEGSVSVAEEDTVSVSVWNRRATVTHDGHEVFLVAGERTEMWEGNVLTVKQIPDSAYDQPWVSQNLQRDAVHRQEIAQMQQERRVASAGILPTSMFYPVKRVAEQVDVLLTFSEEGRVQKQIRNAETRLNEAAALIADGDDASESIEEYQETLTALVTTSGGSTTQFLVQQSLVETSADNAAAIPGDEGYVIKKAVLVASAGLPDSMFAIDDIQGMLTVDAIAALDQAVERGDIDAVQETWSEIQPSLELLNDVQPEVRKEATTLLSHFAVAVTAWNEEFTVFPQELITEVSRYLPPEAKPLAPVLTEEDITVIAFGIKTRIFRYDMKQSRINQFVSEVRALEGHPEQGRILRELFMVLPDGPEHFPERVRRAITEVRWEQASS